MRSVIEGRGCKREQGDDVENAKLRAPALAVWKISRCPSFVRGAKISPSPRRLSTSALAQHSTTQRSKVFESGCRRYRGLRMQVEVRAARADGMTSNSVVSRRSHKGRR
ncbi:hypothetical protein PsYK624_013820 [Phanerochaete sordida]|uniref:Uncharacterized protein n=1 Tax=Phanerochaete sordida TaxID=48140 RepID=A0A9P3L8S4_9APHY|nr:hypothetical protein PsYK624_013820 [Phanerochaete sordida]